MFTLALPGRVVFGRGAAADLPAMLARFGGRGVVVHGASPARAAPVLAALPDALAIACAAEPDLATLDRALARARAHRPDWVAAIGGGSALDLGKALAGLIAQPGAPLDYLEVVGRGLPLAAPPLPFIAAPTTAGTGAEATKNAVIAVPDGAAARKVSLRDDRMLARLAVVDPALSDGCPWPVTLASGLDAVAQVIEPYLSNRANPLTDALCLPAIRRGMAALARLRAGEDAGARDDMALVSLTGGIALANAGLGAVHGLAGVIGGVTGAAHGAICGALLVPVLRANAAQMGGGRMADVQAALAPGLGCGPDAAFDALAAWVRAAGLPRLADLGLRAGDHAAVAAAAQGSSSMRGNPVALDDAALIRAMAAA